MNKLHKQIISFLRRQSAPVLASTIADSCKVETSMIKQCIWYINKHSDYEIAKVMAGGNLYKYWIVA